MNNEGSLVPSLQPPTELQRTGHPRHLWSSIGSSSSAYPELALSWFLWDLILSHRFCAGQWQHCPGRQPGNHPGGPARCAPCIPVPSSVQCVRFKGSPLRHLILSLPFQPDCEITEKNSSIKDQVELEFRNNKLLLNLSILTSVSICSSKTNNPQISDAQFRKRITFYRASPVA